MSDYLISSHLEPITLWLLRFYYKQGETGSDMLDMFSCLKTHNRSGCRAKRRSGAKNEEKLLVEAEKRAKKDQFSTGCFPAGAASSRRGSANNVSVAVKH